MIRNREKDVDYVPNEIWKFSAWCGRKAPVTVQRIFTKEYTAAPTCVKCGQKSQHTVCDYCVAATCLKHRIQKKSVESVDEYPDLPVYPLLPPSPALPLLPPSPAYPLLPPTPKYPLLPPSPVNDEDW